MQKNKPIVKFQVWIVPIVQYKAVGLTFSLFIVYCLNKQLLTKNP